uniref:C2H2-type domain-containing protein n=1 Tax=Cacopsylla melanoneura TaxID=428564 RepID=A0A8D8VWM7_9HEMI
MRRILCPVGDCTEALQTMQALDAHVENVHNVKSRMQEMVFSRLEDFRAWKTSYEKEEKIQYVYNTAPRKCSSVSKRPKKLSHRPIKAIHYLHCHRSFQSQGVGKKRVGSNKINKACPSRIIAKEYLDGGVHVTLWSVHIGHEIDISRTRLTKEDRQAFAGRKLIFFLLLSSSFFLLKNTLTAVYMLHCGVFILNMRLTFQEPD